MVNRSSPTRQHQPTPIVTGFRIAGTRSLVVECPFCYALHGHGLIERTDTDALDHRRADCGRGGYFLEIEDHDVDPAVLRAAFRYGRITERRRRR